MTKAEAYWKQVVLDALDWDKSGTLAPSKKQIGEIVNNLLNDDYLWTTIDQFVLEHIKRVVNDGNN